MQWFYNLKISLKLVIGFVVVAMIAGVVGVTGVINIKSIDNDYTQMYKQNTVPLGYLEKAAVQFQRVRFTIIYIIANDSGFDTYMENIKKYDKEVDDNLAECKKLITTDAEQKEFDNIGTSMEKYKSFRAECLNLALLNNDKEALEMTKGEFGELSTKIDDSITKLYELNLDEAAKRSDENSATANQAVLMMIIFIGVGMVLAVVLGLFISRIISNPIRKMVEAADKLAVGDVNVNVEATSKDEIGSLLQSFGRMVENIREQALAAEKIAAGDLTVKVKVKSENDLLGKKLSEMIETNNEILSNISSASDQVAAGARQVSASSQMLSQGSTEQASSIEEITSSMTQVASQTKQNAANANQANQLALTAKENAVQGNSQMQGMVKAMAEINDSSANISKIIKVIDEIAFQTNILALNAAVEAARAGQHGKGFAVVAEEVRNLAARSANAAKETTEMIENSIKKVETGTEIANNTAEALNKIVDGVTTAAELVGDIAAASNEQASGIAQINQAISQVAQVVQTNSATAEESASASEELSSQAELLKSAVSRFRLSKVKSNSGFDGGLNSDMVRMIENIVEKKKVNSHLDQLSSVSAGDNHSKEISPKATISLEDNNFGKY
ncbi:methyl-accepting chemotaxis protein [Pseudobacteroides cellulosolvens]|uniref:Methyl-accepting chemotaxis sensory transducer n=1 Tax=Pseudobacteroides cellulosolvens ATCC 35603 = DSM 2933 TaxID=398512 RepID=A0A0L6JUB9_9FIRM|nr:methyl-accepting chemotaxis protein [Pseudobacteroides cellulosolvens]KNY29314.1 methyl-accepting chemotaxis sensory transducer [Pseudobacteroides cellulosolvens ATCC 35603 = DSM 2933]